MGSAIFFPICFTFISLYDFNYSVYSVKIINYFPQIIRNNFFTLISSHTQFYDTITFTFRQHIKTLFFSLIYLTFLKQCTFLDLFNQEFLFTTVNYK